MWLTSFTVLAGKSYGIVPYRAYFQENAPNVAVILICLNVNVIV